jgi:hypothetical protein
MVRFLGNFSLTCGCEYSHGSWFSCTSHPEWCQLCETPLARGSQGLCAECLDMVDHARPWELKVSVA